MNLLAIVRGWTNLILLPPHIKKIAEERIKICNTCPNLMQVDPLKNIPIPGKELFPHSVIICGLCGCPLKALTCDPGSACRAGKWKKVDVGYY